MLALVSTVILTAHREITFWILNFQMTIAINIPCKFGEDIFINKWNTKVNIYVKTRWTDGQTDATLMIGIL